METKTTLTTTLWTLDKAHSEIIFKARHLLISTVTGQLKNFEARVETEGDDFETAKAHFEGDVTSITTGVDQRDAHLMSDDFF